MCNESHSKKIDQPEKKDPSPHSATAPTNNLTSDKSSLEIQEAFEAFEAIEALEQMEALEAKQDPERKKKIINKYKECIKQLSSECTQNKNDLSTTKAELKESEARAAKAKLCIKKQNETINKIQNESNETEKRLTEEINKLKDTLDKVMVSLQLTNQPTANKPNILTKTTNNFMKICLYLQGNILEDESAIEILSSRDR